jgi:hypothetical protein
MQENRRANPPIYLGIVRLQHAVHAPSHVALQRNAAAPELGTSVPCTSAIHRLAG